METQHSGRSSFSGKLGFVLSAAGASVGLGNIWRFPYLAAKYGGGIFLLIYILLAATFGYEADQTKEIENRRGNEKVTNGVEDRRAERYHVIHFLNTTPISRKKLYSTRANRATPARYGQSTPAMPCRGVPAASVTGV